MLVFALSVYDNPNTLSLTPMPADSHNRNEVHETRMKSNLMSCTIKYMRCCCCCCCLHLKYFVVAFRSFSIPISWYRDYFFWFICVRRSFKKLYLESSELSSSVDGRWRVQKPIQYSYHSNFTHCLSWIRDWAICK